jgi:hypothetical protein
MSKKHREEKNAVAAPAAAPPSRMADYFWANVVFFSFLLVLAFIVRKSCEAPGDDVAVRRVLDDAFGYLLMLFGGGFLLVTLFDAAYEFFAARSADDAEDAGAGASGQA